MVVDSIRHTSYFYLFSRKLKNKIMNYICKRAFTSTKGKAFYHRNKITSSEYQTLSYLDKSNFELYSESSSNYQNSSSTSDSSHSLFSFNSSSSDNSPSYSSNDSSSSFDGGFGGGGFSGGGASGDW